MMLDIAFVTFLSRIFVVAMNGRKWGCKSFVDFELFIDFLDSSSSVISHEVLLNSFPAGARS